MSAIEWKVCKSYRRLFYEDRLYTIDGYYQCRDCGVVFDKTNRNERLAGKDSAFFKDRVHGRTGTSCLNIKGAV